MRLVLLPGMGCDRRLFEPQASLPFAIDPYDWLPHKRGETLVEYSRRMAEVIDPMPPFAIVGVSMGGMVGCEVARLLNPGRLILVGSATSGRAVNGMLAALRPLHAWTPPSWFAVGLPLVRWSLALDRCLTPAHRDLVVSMLHEASPAFLHWASGAIMYWRPAGNLKTPMSHIHGRKDHLIPARRAHADVTVPGAGHFINLTHADAVNRYIIEQVQRH